MINKKSDEKNLNKENGENRDIDNTKELQDEWLRASEGLMTV